MKIGTVTFIRLKTCYMDTALNQNNISVLCLVCIFLTFCDVLSTHYEVMFLWLFVYSRIIDVTGKLKSSFMKL